MQVRSSAYRLASLLVALGISVASIGSAPAAAQDAPTATAAPSEIDGQINGRKARFVARGDDVLVSAAEADRIGLSYRDGKSISIGGTPLWIVTLGSVTAAGRTRLVAPAGVVPSIPGYFAALRAHPAEAFARSREIQVEINGLKLPAYDLGEAGVLLALDVAEGAGVKFREGKRQDIGAIRAWVLEMAVKVGAQESPTTVIVTEPEAYFQALMAAAGKAR
jgi:hypothetical protein